MAIQDEMYKMIVSEIDKNISEGKQKIIVDYDKAKKVAKMLTALSTEPKTADSLVNQYVTNIKNLCK